MTVNIVSLSVLWKRLWEIIANEPLVVGAAVIASTNAVHSGSIEQYVIAGALALGRFVVSGPLTTAKAKTAAAEPPTLAPPA